MTMIEEATIGPDGGGAASHRAKAGSVADAVAAQLRALELMSITTLRVAWRRLYRAEPPKRVNRELLILAIAWKITAATKRRLAELAVSMERDEDVKRARIARLKPGAKLVREWQGRTHTIVVVEDGFTWRGRQWQSLSAIARAITGVRWSGPRFFGLKNMSRGESTPEDVETANA